LSKFGRLQWKPLITTSQDKIDFKKSTKCWICGKDFIEGDKKVGDHCHYSGRFKGGAHNKCNSLFRKPKFVPVIFHNLSGYDSRLFVKFLNVVGNGNIDCIPNTEEKYTSVSKSIYDSEKKFNHKIRFTDNFKLCQPALTNLLKIE